LPGEPTESVVVKARNPKRFFEQFGKLVVERALDVRRLEPLDEGRCRLVATTSNPWWYIERLAAIPADYQIVNGPELRAAARTVGQRLQAAANAADSD